MRRVFVIGDVPTWATAQAVEAAIGAYLEAREDVAHFRVFVSRNRVNVTQIPDPVADELRKWYAEKLRSRQLTT